MKSQYVVHISIRSAVVWKISHTHTHTPVYLWNRLHNTKHQLMIRNTTCTNKTHSLCVRHQDNTASQVDKVNLWFISQFQLKFCCHFTKSQNWRPHSLYPLKVWQTQFANPVPDLFNRTVNNNRDKTQRYDIFSNHWQSGPEIPIFDRIRTSGAVDYTVSLVNTICRRSHFVAV